jgi:acetyl esterase/lipase
MIKYKLATAIVGFVLCLVTWQGCTFRSIRRDKGLVYQKGEGRWGAQELNVFRPRRVKEPVPVFVFIHGGDWNSGTKKLYNFLGSRMARKGIMTVVIDYPLSPYAGYRGMARASARATAWVKENASRYGGDSSQIYVGGHSAGGHLAALIGLDNSYFDSLGMANPIKGIVLIDAAGLDMAGYLAAGGLKDASHYRALFGSTAQVWEEASPIFHLKSRIPPMLIFMGGRTYPSIARSNKKFIDSLTARKVNYRYVFQPRKKHIPMITQFLYSFSPRYTDITRFINENKSGK